MQMSVRHFLVLLSQVSYLATAAATTAGQAEYDEFVGHAYAYSRGPMSMARYCKHAFTQLADKVDTQVAEWRVRNAATIHEIEIHWDAFDARGKGTHVTGSSRNDWVDRQNDEMISSALRKADESSAGYSFAYCQAVATGMLRDARFDLEVALAKQLGVLRGCREMSYCPKAAALK